jgi:hypothetical protein
MDCPLVNVTESLIGKAPDKMILTSDKSPGIISVLKVNAPAIDRNLGTCPHSDPSKQAEAFSNSYFIEAAETAVGAARQTVAAIAKRQLRSTDIVGSSG